MEQIEFYLVGLTLQHLNEKLNWTLKYSLKIEQHFLVLHLYKAEIISHHIWPLCHSFE